MLSAVCIPATRIQSLPTEIKFPVGIERGSHPFPFRTRQLSLSSPMILRGQLCGKVGRRRDKIYERPSGKLEGFFFSAHSSRRNMTSTNTNDTAYTADVDNAIPATPIH